MIFVIEGLDRLGKDTLINGIKNELGYHNVLHRSKPEALDFYEKQEIKNGTNSKFAYQYDCFFQDMSLIAHNRSDAKFIFNRAWLGETVYAPLYRGYSGDYVFELEKYFEIDMVRDLRLILLTEDFEIADHFVDDGESFDITKRKEEQQMFINAFDKSIIADKRIICVTDPALSGFKPPHWILDEALLN